jgi:hypothetical protein
VPNVAELPTFQSKLHADKGYDYPACRKALRRRGVIARIARRGIESSKKLGRHRYVIERTLERVSRFAVSPADTNAEQLITWHSPMSVIVPRPTARFDYPRPDDGQADPYGPETKLHSQMIKPGLTAAPLSEQLTPSPTAVGDPLRQPVSTTVHSQTAVTTTEAPPEMTSNDAADLRNSCG